MRYLFDVEFDPRDTRLSSDVKSLLAAAEAEAYRRGFAAAESEAHARIERQLGTALAAAAEQLAELRQRLFVLEGRLEAEAVEVALAIARKLAPALIAREPVAEIEALVVDVLAHVRTAPHLVVRVAEDLLEPASDRLKQVAEERGFAGRLVLMPAPELASDEVRVEWADGGVERDRGKIEERIAEAVNNYLARGSASAPVPSESEP